MTCGDSGRESREVAPLWVQITRSVTRAAASIVLLPYGPNSTSGWVSSAACILSPTSLPVSRTSRSTSVHGGGRRAACLAHRERPVAQACPNGASGPVKGVTSAARRLVMIHFLLAQISNLFSTSNAFLFFSLLAYEEYNL